MPKSYYIYINSKNRDVNEKVSNFNIVLKNPIICNKNEAFSVSVIGFSMMNTDYNLRNTTLYIQELHYTPIIYSQLHIISIPNGNYSYLTLMDYLKNNSEFNTYLNIEYIKERNSYKFTNKMTEGQVKILPFKFIGVNSELIVNTSAESSYINLTNYSHIIIKSNSLDFEDNANDNINDTELKMSSILFMIDKQDIPPFHLISYKNNDSGENYSYNISNKQISNIDLHLYNELGEELINVSDYFLTIKIIVNVIEKKESNISFLNDIRFILMNMLFNKKNLIL